MVSDDENCANEEESEDDRLKQTVFGTKLVQQQ